MADVEWVIKIPNFDTDEHIKEFIKKNYEPVADKPGYFWLNKRNFQIISIETLTKALKDFSMRVLPDSPLTESEDK